MTTNLKILTPMIDQLSNILIFCSENLITENINKNKFESLGDIVSLTLTEVGKVIWKEK